MEQSDVLIIGCGIAGSVAALKLAKRGYTVTLISSGETFLDNNSSIAQGGICALGENDGEEKFSEDILIAGDGLCNIDAVKQLTSFGPKLVNDFLLQEAKVPFNKTADGKVAYTKEAAHSESRILYHKDQTGRAIMQALHEKIKAADEIKLYFSHHAIDLITLSHHSQRKTDIYYPLTCVGAYVFNEKKAKVETFLANETILATGGVGDVFLHSTNCKEAKGDGIAMAFRAGVRIMNMEYVQFHPTSLFVSGERRFLLSETLRGEGGKILTYDHKPFMHTYHEEGDLAPRAIVARAIYDQMDRNKMPHVWLDISFKNASWLKQRFPHIYSKCLEKGYDLTTEPLPIVPAAHYSCGGIAVDLSGKTSMRRLWAIGEVACTGLHGANRLASTSLLEGVVWGDTCAEAISKQEQDYYFPAVDEWIMGDEEVDLALVNQDLMMIKQTLWNYVGISRGHDRLIRALKMLMQLKWEIGAFYEKAQLCPELIGLRHALETALLITKGAMQNKDSRGCHYLQQRPSYQL